MRMTHEEVHTWQGQTLCDNDDNKIGEIVDVYTDSASGEPEWLAVKTGWFGTKVSFVPIREASRHDDRIRVPYDKALVKDAPHVDADGSLTPDEERRLYEHYSMDFGDWDYDRDDDRYHRPMTDDAMTRSEEELHVGTAPVEQGRARLRKYIETEQVQKTVPVSREEVRVEREPITDANRDAALDGPELSEEEHEVTLYSEEPVVEKRVVPKERVRLDKDRVTDERDVSADVRKEQIDTEGHR